ncbi:hypothetical protein BKP45_08670 [Anaerobacillus alkalidiazotrophicus]|uniref:Uncharacterized protein n=1 Tax=Anaerobacillus alkalidiazotrophicus TaxID=472963 RepID=A0A1S2M7Z4_9BACI|nr:hypothetical protein [Anaerobacillus alkalidiazotrophicus]OIJ20706.1 hypothetical protein BKP45_08670 [Anaerobacillus alkalidiazotrophicus]
MFTVDQYISSIKANLEKHSDVLVANLKNIFTYNFFSEIDLLDFTAFIEPTNFEISIRMFSMDKEANEVFYEGNDTTVLAGSVDVIPDIKYYQLNDNLLDDFIDNFYEENYPAISELEQKAFIDWFSENWKKSGGNILNLPSFFVFHDDIKSYDLKSNQWVDDDDKWS